MSGPQDPRQWQPQGQGGEYPSDATQAGSPWQQQPSQDATWHAPAYTPTEYPQYQQPEQPYQQQYPAAAPGYGQQSDFGSQPTQYGAIPQYDQYQQPAAPQYGQPQQQYGQPAQPGQYGQPAQPAQYPGQYGPPASGPKRSKGLIFGLIGGGVGLLVIVLLVLLFVAPGWAITTKLDVNKANAGVQQILSDETNGYGAKNVKDVKCNNGSDPTVKQGGTFDCTVSIDGASKHVTVTFQNDDGTYEVGRPQ